MEGIDCKQFYMEYINDYLTVGHIAGDYGIEMEEAYELITLGREYFI